MLELGPARIFLNDTTVTATTAGAAVGITDTSITLTAVTGFPTSGIAVFTESSKTEHVFYDGVDVSGKKLLNCVRGILGTTAQTFTTAATAGLLARDLGKTLGGINLSVETSTIELKSDQSGETAEDESISGRTFKIEASLADITLENFAASLGTVVVGSTTAKKVLVGPGTGTSLISAAKRGYIIPLDNGVPTKDGNRTIHILKAGIKASLDMKYDASTQRVIKLAITAYPQNGTSIVIGDMAAA